MRGSPVLAGLVVISTVALAGADYFIKERLRPTGMPDEVTTEQPTGSGFTVDIPATGSTATIAIQTSSSSLSSSGKRIVKKGTSTKKQTSVDVNDVFTALALPPQETNEASILKLTLQGAAVQTVVLLNGNDRAFLFSWVENDDVKSIFADVKGALQEQFSGKVSGLIDETRTPEDGPPVDILSFTDPALSKERILFLRVRNRLYEIHVAENGANMLQQLIEALSK